MFLDRFADLYPHDVITATTVGLPCRQSHSVGEGYGLSAGIDFVNYVAPVVFASAGFVEQVGSVRVDRDRLAFWRAAAVYVDMQLCRDFAACRGN